MTGTAPPLTGTSDNDVFSFTQFSETPISIAGGDGLDDVRIVQGPGSYFGPISLDFRQTAFSSIERVAFQTAENGGDYSALVLSSQFGSGLATNLLVEGSFAFGGGGTEHVAVVMDAAGTFDARAWRFSQWNAASNPSGIILNATDYPVFIDSSGDDRIYGPSVATSYQMHAGRNIVFAGNGADLIRDMGSAGRGTYFGNGGSDYIQGGGAADFIYGGNADDDIDPGLGLDYLVGGAGNDRFVGTAAAFSGDTIGDFGAGDAIQITDATLAGFSFSFSGGVLNFTGGALALPNLSAAAQFSVTTNALGGVWLEVDAPATALASPAGSAPRARDFNGDGRDDILWRNVDGTFGDWLGRSGGGFDVNAMLHHVPTDWKIVGAGDFDGDGRDDVLWRNDSGAFGDWLGRADGGFDVNPTLYQIPLDWKIAGTGDSDGDGRDDILWRNDSGAFGDWLGRTDRGFDVNPTLYQIPTDWKIAGTGDFNGDGRSDILWFNDDGTFGDWLGRGDRGFDVNPTLYQIPSAWRVAGTGDFNGDGREDILWRNEDGNVGQWFGQANGSFVIDDVLSQMPEDWQIAATGDVNGDGRDDFLGRDGYGVLSDWIRLPDGTFALDRDSLQVLAHWVLS